MAEATNLPSVFSLSVMARVQALLTLAACAAVTGKLVVVDLRLYGTVPTLEEPEATPVAVNFPALAGWKTTGPVTLPVAVVPTPS